MANKANDSNTGNPFMKKPYGFGSRDDYDYLRYIPKYMEPNKETDIAKNEKQAEKARQGIQKIINPIPLASKVDRLQIEWIFKHPDLIKIAFEDAPVVEIDVDSIQTIQKELRPWSLDYRRKHNSKQLPVVIQLQGRTNVVIDGNHRIAVAKEQGLKRIKVRLSKHTDYYFN